MGDVGIMGMHVPGMSWREMRDSAVLAEELGYSCLSMGESWGEDALTSLAQLAAVTSRIRIGTSIVPVFARSPANLAMAALNLDRMSEGRFFLGLGTSGRLVIQDLHGERFDKPLDAHAGVHRHHPQGLARRDARPRRGVLPHQALPAPASAVSAGPAHLHRRAQPGEPAPDRRAGRRVAADLPRARRAWPPRWPSSRRARRAAGRSLARHRDLAAGVDLRHRGRRGRPRPRAPPHRVLHRRHGRVLSPVHAPHRLRRRGRPGPRGVPGAGSRRAPRGSSPTRWWTR